MFGAIMAVFLTFYLIYTLIINSIDDNDGKKRYRNDKFGTYIDHNGVCRDLKTNRYRSVVREHDGDVYIWGKDIGKVNQSQKLREAKYQEYKRKYDNGEVLDRTTVYWNPSPIYDASKDVNILGKRYKDIKTERILIVREHNYKQYYVAINTMEVLRYTDFYAGMLKESGLYSKEDELKSIRDFQELIDKQRRNPNYVGDPTRGKNSSALPSRLEDYRRDE